MFKLGSNHTKHVFWFYFTEHKLIHTSHYLIADDDEMPINKYKWHLSKTLFLWRFLMV